MTNRTIAGIAAVGLAFMYLRTRASVSPGAIPGAGSATVPPNAPNVVTRWKDLALEFGAKYQVSPQLILAIIWQESNGSPGAVGSIGEQGLMQVTYGAALDAGFGESYAACIDPRINIRVGTAYLRLQYERWKDAAPDMRESDLWYNAVRAYNGGFAGTLNNRKKSESYANDVFHKAGWS